MKTYALKLFIPAIVLFAPILLYAQNRISGKVVHPDGTPIEGISVGIKHSFTGTVTNQEGVFILYNIPQGTVTLLTSSLNYYPVEKTMAIFGDTNDIVITLTEKSHTLDAFVVESVRKGVSPEMATTKLEAADLEKQNLGQDIPILLQNTPSVVSTSDAGNGIGYTGIRIRGSDGTRINVTMNGIPLNDAESHGVWWVNMPDIISSSESVEIHRGLGASTNGSGAFGATISMETDHLNDSAYGVFSSSYGSFNSQKQSLKLGTGLLPSKLAFDTRISTIKSDGYLDRASSNLTSYYISGGYYGEKTLLKFVGFSGKEKTYQAWWGTPQSRLENDTTAMLIHASNNGMDTEETQNLLQSGRTYNYYQYKNETDNYHQDHYQLHFSQKLNQKTRVNSALHYTYGRGYYEQYKKNAKMQNHAMDAVIHGNDTISKTDLVRRRWLDNHFYGGLLNISHNFNKGEVILGTAWNQYYGDHFGEVIWAKYASNALPKHRFYDNTGIKTDFNTFVKTSYQINNNIQLSGDLQVRRVGYLIGGNDIDFQNLQTDTALIFFNPKAGFTWKLNQEINVYGYVGMGNREPVRNDIIDNPSTQQPKHETLIDYELGTTYLGRRFSGTLNLFYMDYKNQLVLTGALNDVGSPIRTNVENSYRGGIEATFNYKIHKTLVYSGNISLSTNKIATFDEVLYDYTNGYEVKTIQHKQTDISFSPGFISAQSIVWEPFKNTSIQLTARRVGRQYLDNTSNQERSIAPYFVSDLNLNKTFTTKKLRAIAFNFMVNNLFNTLYANNGYTYSYYYGDLITENFYYPQAGIHVMGGMTIKF